MGSGLCRFLLGPLLLLAGLEALFWLAPLPDPYAHHAGQRFHRYLASWNHWAWNPWSRGEPPLRGWFDARGLGGVTPRIVEYQVNEHGFLYPATRQSRSGRDEIRVAVIGGSTVECIALQPDRAWPAVLEEVLRKRHPGRPVSVLNLGLTDEGTGTHLATAAQHAVRLELDFAVFMLGANELRRAAPGWRPMFGEKDFYRIETSVPGALRFLATRGQLGRRLLAAYAWGGAAASKGEGLQPQPYFARALAERHALAPFPGVVALDETALRDYGTDIQTLAGIMAAHGVRALFTTQPTLWKERPTPEEEAVDWLGTYKAGERSYRLEAAASAGLIRALNERLLATCAAERLACLDLAREISPTLEHFYDPVHFNEEGARRVAEAVAHRLAP